VDRRSFVEGLGAFCIAANAGLLGRASVLNSEVPGALRADNPPAPLIPIPDSTRDVSSPLIDLAGEWRTTMHPPENFWSSSLDISAWSPAAMPNEFAALGFKVMPDLEYPCRRTISIPPAFKGQRVFLRFDGVYGYARVWVNGAYIRDHFGGFTSWDCDITDHVKPGEQAQLVLGITDRSDDISQASYYAKHPIAGILRGVRLFAVPPGFLARLATTVNLDAQYKDGTIAIEADLDPTSHDPAVLQFKLLDKSGKSVPIRPGSLPLAPGKTASASLLVPAPQLWDAEHPNLYTLEISVISRNAVSQTFRRTIGFRSVKREGNQLLVNGRPVKLRGVCRHSIHPTYGRAVPPEFDEMDAALFRAGNINFVRTSHYPPSEQFLDACDRHGIYIEEESAVCWSQVEGGPSSDPAFRSRFLSQFQEMVSRDRHHASVLFWSLGNESHWGDNFAAEQKFASENDPFRPTIFSYPDTAPVHPAFDIYSKHYPDVAADLSSSSHPQLNDEFGHVSCYNLATLRRDPGVREFWGHSIQKFGEKFLADDGCLGGSIWAGIDEVFLLPDGPVGYGPWGVIDGWRRPKPEYWLTKKAYSPVRIDDRPIVNTRAGESLAIPVSNAFDHTNFNELEIRWSSGASGGALPAIDLPPHQSGLLEIPFTTWKPGDVVQLDFHFRGLLVDQFKMPIGMPEPQLPIPQSSQPPVLKKTSDSLEVTGAHFAITFSDSTGLITDAKFDGEMVLAGGPYVDFGSGPLIAHWLLRKCEAKTDQQSVTVLTSGECKLDEGIESIPVEFEIEIDGAGLITTRYRIAEHRSKSPVGISYLLSPKVGRIAWHRKSLWSAYPDDHIGRPRGIALKRADHPPCSYAAKPDWPWHQDTADVFLWGKDGPFPQEPNDFRALKERIWYASCVLAGSNIRARAEARDADLAARAAVNPAGQVIFSLYNFWPYPDLDWGNYTGVDAAPAIATREVRLRLTDLPEEK
jgi:hypothetical protein